MRKSTQNYILMAMGLTVICLMFLFHLLQPISYLLNSFNHLADYVNKRYDRNITHQTVAFFGEEMESVVVLIDTIIVVIIVVVGLMVFLPIYWREQEMEKINKKLNLREKEVD